MEVVRIPSDSFDSVDLMIDDTHQQQLQQPAPPPPPPQPLPQPKQMHRRPYDVVVEAGPPADPVKFPQPTVVRGRRGEVCCYNPKTQNHEMAKNVLFRDYSREFEDGDGRVTCAYWPVPLKKPIRTIMGHVEICMVLRRSTGQGCDNTTSQLQDNDDDSSSSSEGLDDEDDIIFELTDEMVAVKVNYSHRMDELRHKHAEDPLKEIAAMQIIGNQHPNIMGCIDVLFDGQSLCVVMRYCGSGDLFQLLQNSSRDDGQPGMTEGQARYWFRQVIAGLKHIQNVGICHRGKHKT